MSSLATIVWVHAHPDDEAFFGAGAAAHYSALGHRTVLVTCTDGALGFDGAGRAGSEPGHDPRATRATRAGELQRAAAILGFSRVVTLGYADSGMAGWPENESPTAFVNADVDAVARQLAALFDEEGATVVVTYDENGFYGHPDHVTANVVTRRAILSAATVERLYYPVVPEGVLATFVDGAQRLGLSLPAWVSEASTLVPDDVVTTTLDARGYVSEKHAAIAAHASQIDNDDLVAMNRDLFEILFGTEYYQRAWARREVRGDETDLLGV